MLLLEIQGKKVNFIGDPHLGKKFGGVPLHRYGDREILQYNQFVEELNADTDVTIMVGDLFDTFNVSNEVLLDTYSAIKEAAEKFPEKVFILISGNHDISRDSDVLSSYNVLETMLARFHNIKSFMKIGVENVNGLNILLCPYSMFTETIKELEPYKNKKFDLVVGHWDTLEIAGIHNFIPMGLLAKMTNIVVSGHEHVPYKFYITPDGQKTTKETDVVVYGTGSMQPYSHGEDPDGKFYVTKTIEQVLELLSDDPHYFKFKALRLILAPDETPPDNIEALQFSIKRVTISQKEELEVTLGDFSFKEIFKETFKENNVSVETTERMWEKYKQKASDDN